jgi:SAM-dependent methyltransferase
MRALPFADASFASVLSVQAIEHVPDPALAVAEARRVLVPGGLAIFVTPNRLTFGVRGEIVDPYHHVEFSAPELVALCEGVFESVQLLGIFGSSRYLDHVAAERATLARLIRLDPLRFRRWVPRGLRKRLYDWALRRRRRDPDALAAAIDASDFELGDSPLAEALDLVAVCRRPA